MFEGKSGFEVSRRDIVFDSITHCPESELNTTDKQFVFVEQLTQHLGTESECIASNVNEINSE